MFWARIMMALLWFEIILLWFRDQFVVLALFFSYFFICSVWGLWFEFSWVKNNTYSNALVDVYVYVCVGV